MLTFFFKNLRAGKISFRSFLIMLIVSGATFGIAFLPSYTSDALKDRFMPGHAQLFGMYDSSYQRMGHKVGLILLGLMVLKAVVLRKHQEDALPTSQDAALESTKHLKRLIVGLLLAGALFSSITYNVSLSGIICLFLSLPFVILFLKFSQNISKRRMFIAAWLAIIVYLLSLTVPAFLVDPYVPAEQLGAVQFHHAIVLSWADRLAIDPGFFAQRLPHYGLILPSLLGAFQRHFGLLDFGQHIRLVQAAQMLFLILSCLALYLWRPRRPLSMLVALMLFGTYVSTSHSAVLYPNQSGWRFIGFPLWIILLLAVKNMSLRPTGFILGCASAILLLFNLETGIAMTIGTIAFLISRDQYVLWRERSYHAMLFAIGGISALVAFCALFWAGFGQLPFSISALAGHRLMSNFNAGYGGLRLQFDILAICIFMHGVYLVSSTILRWRDRGVSHSSSMKLAIASAILAWFAYYMNRPGPWNLWTFLFLYSFLMIDLIDGRLLMLRWSKFGIQALTDLRVAALTWLILPALLQLNYAHLKNTVSFVNTAIRPDLAPISGVNVQRDVVELLKDKVAYLERISDKAKIIYLSRDDELIPLMTKQLNPFDVQDVYLENFGSSEFEQLVNEIRKNGPKYIILDEPVSLLVRTDFAAPFRMTFFHNVMNELADRYREIGGMSDWRIWERTMQ